MAKKIKCRNCGTVFVGNFCNNCGQNADVHRFNFAYLLKETFTSSLDIENGFFATIKTLSLNPGNAIRDYVNGKRLSLAVPVRYLIIMGTLATFLSIKYKIYVDYASDKTWIEDLLKIDHGFWVYAAEFNTVVNILAVPVFAFFTWLFFRPKGFNYSENFILNTYIVGQQLFLFLFFFPFIEIFLSHKNLILNMYNALSLLYSLWVYITFFRMVNWTGLVLVVLASVFAFIGQFIVNYGTYLILDAYKIIPHLKQLDL